MSATTEPKPVVIPLPDENHLQGCPHDVGRTECYELTRPTDGKPVTVVRCVDCTGQKVYEGDIARVSKKLNSIGDNKNGRREGKDAGNPDA